MPSSLPPAGPGALLPPPSIRAGGAHFQDDAAFVAAAVRDVERLEDYAGLSRASRLLDWGCGAGRLAVGVKRRLGNVADYHGVDVRRSAVGWAQRHLTDDHTRFSLVDAANARYNPNGTATAVIPAEPGSVDVFYAYSVLSHMLVDDLRAYAPVIAGLLAPRARALLTAFVEEDVPDCAENPPGYGPLSWNGRLHCVRYERRFFEDVLRGVGLVVERFEHGQETDGQSLYVIARR